MQQQASLISSLSKLNPLEIKQLRQLFNRDVENANNGDLYTIYIHIIECRDLKPIESDNICQPICCIDILNKKLSTKRSTKTFNPYFDQILVFKINLTSNQLSSEKIKISIFDTNNMIRNVLIGLAHFDLNYIYFNCKHHEIYKKWIGLFNPNQIKQEIKGYLKLSITILGPNDEKYVHSNIDNEDQDNINNNVILPPFIEYQYKQLIINIYELRYLPNLFISNKKKHRKYKIMIQFCDKKLISKEITILNEAQKIINFNKQFLIPLRIPNFNKNINISLLQENKLISKLIIDYNQLFKNNDDNNNNIKYYKLYGSHFDFKKYKLIKNNLIANKMNNGLIEECCFRGEIGINFNLISIDSNQAQKTQILPIKSRLYEMDKKLKIEKTIKFQMYEITNLISGKYQIKIECIDKYCKTTIKSTNDNHNICWNETLYLNGIDINDINQYIFIYLLQIIDKSRCIPFAYYKLKLKDLMQCDFQTSIQWIYLTIDQCYNLLTPSLPIPLLLLSLNGILDINDIDNKNNKIDFHPFEMNGDIIINIKCKDNNNNDNDLDQCIIYLNETKIKEIRINNNDPFQIELKQENISIYDRLTIHRKCTQCLINKVYGEITLIIADLLSIHSLNDDENKQTEYDFYHVFTTNVQTIYLNNDDINDSNNDKYEKINIYGTFYHRFYNEYNEKQIRFTVKHRKFTLFIGLHQASRLISSDDTGLSDPFVIINLFGFIFKSDIIKKRLNPVWHRGYLFNILLPFPLNYSPPILLQIWDYDKQNNHKKKNDFLGFTHISIKDLFYQQLDIINNLKPKWYSLYILDKKDKTKKLELQSKILLSLQLISGHNQTIKSLNKSLKYSPQNTKLRYIDLTPKLYQVEMQIYILGIRNMNKSGIGVINKPFVTIHFPNGSNLATNPSSKPSIINPNFCQLFTVKMKLPKQSIYAPSIRIAIRDTLIGVGDIINIKTTQKRLGWTFLHLQNYLNNDNDNNNYDGWIHPDQFKKRYMMIKNKEKLDTLKTKKQLRSNKDDNHNDDRINKAIMIKKMLNNQYEYEHEQDDNNVAVYSDDDDNSFGWSTQDALDDNSDDNEKQEQEQEKGDKEEEMSWEDLIGLYRIPELRNKEIYPKELEKELNLKPFIFKEIYCGKAKNQKHIADLKCLVRLKEDNDNDGNNDNNDNLSHLIKPTNIICRLYILRGLNLIPRDSEENNDKSSCDPYFIIRLNDKIIVNTRSEYIADTLNPEWYKQYEIPLIIPGDSSIKLCIYDRNGIDDMINISNNDQLIGSTIIDIEDRWFSSLWHYLNDKPIERRDIFHSSSNFRQGQIEIILQLFNKDISKRIPLLNIKPPDLEEYELRLIIWECKNIISHENNNNVNNINDLYVLCTLKNETQSTDIHYRAKYGNASFNWRMIWNNIYLPCNKPDRIKIQIFDHDLLSSDDSICECIFSLKQLYKMAYIKKDVVTLYENNSNKIWLNNLKHPNFIKNCGEILISLQLLPINIANEYKCGKGRNSPNQNPILFPPNNRSKLLSLNPYKMISNIFGPEIMRKSKLYLLLCCLIGSFIMFAPVIAMSVFQKLIDSLNPL